MSYRKKVASGSRSHNLLQEEVVACRAIIDDVISKYLGTKPFEGKPNPNPDLNRELVVVKAENGDRIEVTVHESGPRQRESWQILFLPGEDDKRFHAVNISNISSHHSISHWLIVRVADAVDLLIEKLIELYPPSKEEFNQYCLIADRHGSS